jgi:hypothetical protein
MRHSHGFYNDPCGLRLCLQAFRTFFHKDPLPLRTYSPIAASPLGGPIGQALGWTIIMNYIWAPGSTYVLYAYKTECTAQPQHSKHIPHTIRILAGLLHRRFS